LLSLKSEASETILHKFNHCRCSHREDSWKKVRYCKCFWHKCWRN